MQGTALKTKKQKQNLFAMKKKKWKRGIQYTATAKCIHFPSCFFTHLSQDFQAF